MGTSSRKQGHEPTPSRAHVYRRHTLAVRLVHWTVAFACAVLFLSGLQIFNSHSMLHWGKSSFTGAPAFFEIGAQRAADGTLRGSTRIGTHVFDTTGVLGASATNTGGVVARAFPQRLTIPSGRNVAMARRWHFFFAWVLVLSGLLYAGQAVVSGRLVRDLLPTSRDWRTFGSSVWDHVRLHRATGDAARRYNVLQRLAYLVVMFALLPGIVLMGLAMSPWLDSLWPGWVDWLGGRETARSLHFIGAWLLVGFVLVHLFEVLVTGVVNNLRSMITGDYRVEPGADMSVAGNLESSDEQGTDEQGTR